MLKFAKRIVILIVGMTVLLIGAIMIVTPGPAIVVIPAGLAILATEFAWARHWLKVIRESAEKGAEKLKPSFFSRPNKENNKQSTADSRPKSPLSPA